MWRLNLNFDKLKYIKQIIKEFIKFKNNKKKCGD